MSFNVEFTKEDAFALLAIVNYMYTSSVDLNKIEDPKERDLAELQMRRSYDDVQSITKEMEIALMPKLSQMHEAMVAEYKADEVVNTGEITT